MRLKRRKPEPDEDTVADLLSRVGDELSAPPDKERWTPADLYGRSVEIRRVMFLELVAWAIAQVERPTSRRDFVRSEEELPLNRERGWEADAVEGAAKDADRFQRYVAGLARGFTDAGGEYALRRQRSA